MVTWRLSFQPEYADLPGMAAITVGTTAVEIPYDPERGLFVQNLGTADIFVDFKATVTTVNGVKVVLGGGTLLLAKQLNEDGGPLYAISGTAGQDVRYLDV